MSKLIIIRGNSGSGKTTIAKALQQELGSNTMLISQDMIRREILKAKDGIDTKAIPLIKELISYGKRNSEVTILEGILYADWYKSVFELAKLEYADNIFAYYFDLPFEETLQRHSLKSNCNEFGEEAMRRWWREGDYIESITEKRLLKHQDIDSIINLILKDIMKPSK